MVLHVFISLLGGVPLCIPYGLYSGTSLGGTTRGTLEGYLGRVLSQNLKLKERTSMKENTYVENMRDPTLPHVPLPSALYFKQ